MKKVIIFGAGKQGLEVLEKYRSDLVECFCDNSPEKWGTKIKNVPVISFDEMVSIYDSEKYVIVVSPVDFAILTGQLEEVGIDDYIVYEIKGSYNYLDKMKTLEEDYAKSNSILDDYIERSQKFDLLDNALVFRNIVNEVLEEYKKGLSLIRSGIGGEGCFYGNLDTLLEYANYNNYNKSYSPIVSHLSLSPLRTLESLYKTAVVFSGKYFKEKIHRWRPYVPVFSIGPYIQYAKGIYSNERIKEIRKRNGKTLTVFLPHSIENISRNYRKEDFIDDVLKRYSEQFDTILLSVYWADMLDDVCDYAERQGMKVVTSGFRFDRMFTKRLRSLLEMTDAIVGGDFGTHYSYAYCLGIKAARIDISDNQTIHDKEFSGDIESRVQFNEHFKNYKKEFYTCYDSDFNHNLAQKKWLQPYAGYDISRSPEYIRNIFDISKDILIECNGELNDYPGAVSRVYQKYFKDGDIEKQAILYESTGGFLNC